MKCVVIGSGLIGLTTAYFLKSWGCEVTLIDRADGAGQETSFANGALLTPSMPEPWNSPGCWRGLLSSLGRSDAAVQLRLRALPSLATWGWRFLRNSKPDRFERNTLSNLRLALYSLEVMQSLRQQESLEYERGAVGTLRLFRKTDALDRATASAERRASAGLQCRRLSTTEVVGLEPGLAPLANQISGALHYWADESGDAHLFCQSLAAVARQLGVEFHFGVEVSSFEMRSNRVMSAICGQDRFRADQFVVAAGSYSTTLLRGIGVQIPIQPAKGYSLTIAEEPSRIPLRVPVLDDDWHAAVVPLAGAIRIAGTAEFAGYDRMIDQKRIGNLLSLLRQVLPQWQFDPAAAKAWCGLRPMSVDGVPIIGPTRISNLFVNSGHGPLGWTMAAGSARLLADIVAHQRPAIDPAPYSLSFCIDVRSDAVAAGAGALSHTVKQ